MQKYICTNCKYVYNPYLGDLEQNIEAGTDFLDVDESFLCPSCREGKEYFHEITQSLQEIYNMDNITPEEEKHVPFYTISDGKIHIMLGTEDNRHGISDEHFIEYIGIFDEDGDILDIKDFPDIDEEIIFDISDLDFFEVRSSCNLHGVWKGMELS